MKDIIFFSVDLNYRPAGMISNGFSFALSKEIEMARTDGTLDLSSPFNIIDFLNRYHLHEEQRFGHGAVTKVEVSDDATFYREWVLSNGIVTSWSFSDDKDAIDEPPVSKIKSIW